MEYNEFIKTIMTLVLVKNDCHYMHLMSKGEDFDKSHHLTQDYFESLGYVIDIISEMALESGNTMYNYSLAGQIIPDYAPENLPAYDYPTLIEHLKTKNCYCGGISSDTQRVNNRHKYSVQVR